MCQNPKVKTLFLQKDKGLQRKFSKESLIIKQLKNKKKNKNKNENSLYRKGLSAMSTTA